MKPPLPPELVRLGDALERDVRERVVHRPRRRQLVLGIVSMFVITVPMAISLTGAELSRPVSELGSQRGTAARTADPSVVRSGPSLGDTAQPHALRRAITAFAAAAAPTPTPYPADPRPFRPGHR